MIDDMKREITVVTAYFDLNRENWNHSSLSREKYAEHFAFWAGIKNHIVVYTDSKMAEKVYQIREQYGLRDKTDVVVIEDCKLMDPELYQSIVYAMEPDSAVHFHLKPQNPESWNATYNYVMLIKSLCVCDAIDRGLVSTEVVAWLDFGYNKSGTLYTEKTEFNFLWEGEFEDKVYYYTLNDIDDTPVFEIIQRMETYIQGGAIIAPVHLWHSYWEIMRESMIELNHCGLCDDDQVIMLMALRKKPEMFKTVKCPWCGVFIGTGIDLTLRKAELVPMWKNIIRRLRTKWNNRKIANAYIKWQYKNIIRTKNIIN